ncbi:endoribonuclease Dicer [Vigna unguiculata]|uniref:Endoribonuclease Dicer n=1 Tax=Vigna unguiculata TaxID=3917 RepID=A0A4D6NP42_VIGUN|nr:endoribonuclease Dicer [Vigna unguiculata]
MGMDVQAQGWKEKSKTLEEVLESTSKMEPKLIGYDETPIDVTDTNIAKNIMELRDHDCMNCVLLIAGNLLHLNAAKKRD